MSGVRDSSRAGCHARCVVLRVQDVRTLSKIDLAANQLPACSGWRFNVIREWQICNAYGFTIYRRYGYMMRCSSTWMQMRSGRVLQPLHIINPGRIKTRPINHSINISFYDTWLKYLAISYISRIGVQTTTNNELSQQTTRQLSRHYYRTMIVVMSGHRL